VLQQHALDRGRVELAQLLPDRVCVRVRRCTKPSSSLAGELPHRHGTAHWPLQLALAPRRYGSVYWWLHRRVARPRVASAVQRLPELAHLTLRRLHIRGEALAAHGALLDVCLHPFQDLLRVRASLMETILILAMEGMHESLNGERRLAARTGASLARRKLRLLTGRRTGRTTSAHISQP
jgi:hypothetical protein